MLDHISMDESTMLNKGIKQVVEWMKESKNVVFLGVGSSFVIIKAMENKFLKNEEKISYLDREQIDETLLTDDTVLIAVSYSGTTKEILDVMNVAISRGVKTVGITAFKDSPLMHMAHLPLACAQSIVQNHNTHMYKQPSLIEVLEDICNLYTKDN